MAPHQISSLAPGALAGRTLGVYQVRALVGAGGMGEVYRARDTKLGRDVAIKILPRAFASDPDRLARFEREARMLATLNHPNICAIYGLEEADGIRFLILELVEGETLASAAKSSAQRVAGCRGGDYRTADRRCPRYSSRARHRPSRLEAREHQDHAGRHGKGARLRPRETDGRQRPGVGPHRLADLDDGRHERRDDSRHGGVHEPGTGARQERR